LFTARFHPCSGTFEMPETRPTDAERADRQTPAGAGSETDVIASMRVDGTGTGDPRADE